MTTKLKKRKVKAGDKIYVRSSYYMSHGEDDFDGGIATVESVFTRTSAGEPCTFITIKERESWSYNWDQDLGPKQAELKKEYGKQKAKPSPDLTPKFNRWD